MLLYSLFLCKREPVEQSLGLILLLSNPSRPLRSFPLVTLIKAVISDLSACFQDDPGPNTQGTWMV